jgi:hypothetical protein
MKYKVFNVEFDGIDKSGKDSIMHQIFSYAPNKYIPKARGLISQLAYTKIFNRDAEYDVSKGYIDNTLFVLLTVDEDDWNIRGDLSHEHENNKNRTDVEAAIEWKSNSDAFENAYETLKTMYHDDRHFMKFNTSETTPVKIIKAVVKRLNELNS